MEGLLSEQKREPRSRNTNPERNANFGAERESTNESGNAKRPGALP
jgi:hypothetical protein